MSTGTRAGAAGARARHPGRRRRAPGWIPNQHGAWAMLATPLLVGVLASSPAWVHLSLTGFWFAGYFAFFAAGLWLKSRRKVRYLPPVRTYGLIAVGLGALTVALQPGLLRWAPLFVVPLGIGLFASATRHERSLVSGLATTASSSLMTLVAYDAGGGTDWPRAWFLAAVLFAYFGGTVVYVKTMIRERGSRAHYALSVAWHVVAALALARRSGLLAAVFGLLAVRSAIFPRLRLTPKTVGLVELGATLLLAWVALTAPL